MTFLRARGLGKIPPLQKNGQWTIDDALFLTLSFNQHKQNRSTTSTRGRNSATPSDQHFRPRTSV
jgi:hypothetical protein